MDPRPPRLPLLSSLPGLLALVSLAACSSVSDTSSECVGVKCDELGDTSDAAVRVSMETRTVFRDYEIDEPSADNHFTVRYRGVARHALTLDLLRVENDYGLSMWFIVDGNASSGAGSAPYGGRLYRATLAGRELLYTNGDGKVSPNWGPRELGGNNIVGWVGLGGAEAAFPTDEHGYYAATTWDYEFHTNDDGSLSFTSSTVGDPGGDGHQRLDLSVTYVVPADGPYWKTSIKVRNPDGNDKNFQYWHNYMLPAGRFDDRNQVEVLLPELSEIEVHSTGDDALKRPGSLGDGGHSVHAFARGNKVAMVHGPQGSAFASQFVQNWLGFFGRGQMVSRYGFYNHSSQLGLGMSSIGGEASIFPKAFGGAGIGPENWTADGSRYVEMWYSINTPNFWNDARLGAGDSLVHESFVYPLLQPEDLQRFDPEHPGAYRLGSEPTPEEPVLGQLGEDFEGASVPANDGMSTGTHAAQWQLWYDGTWGSGHHVELGNGEQRIGLNTGSFGLRRDFGDIGGKILTIDHRFGGDGWYEVLAGEVLLVKHESAFDGQESFVLPAGTSEIKFKVGSQGGGFHEAAIGGLLIE